MKILFQGDSITDVGRNNHSGSLISIGQGYPVLVDSDLSVRYPGQFEFENLGISGNRIVDVYARIKVDCWNHEPDVLSILIGINDVWHDVSHNNGVDAKRFYNVYKMLVEDTLERFPNMKIMLLEPFVLPGTATEEHWEFFQTETVKRQEAVKRIAKECGVIFVPLQKVFDEACKVCPSSYWLGDGVHPMPAGHQLIAKEWIRTFEEQILK